MKTLTLNEIDVLIQKHIFGSEVTTWNNHFSNKRQTDVPIYLTEGGFNYIPRYSEDIKDAWKVVEKIQRKEKLDFEMNRWGENGEYFAGFAPYGKDKDPFKIFFSEGKDAPLAICKAALKIVEIEVESK